MAYVSPGTSVRPNSWLRQLTRLKPARWPVARCVRVALSISIPILVGLGLGSPATFLMMSLGALGLALGEHDGPYAPRFHEIFIIAPLGAVGFFLGYLGELPWAFVIAAMALAAFLAGIISSYGSAFSAGAVQGLLMGCIAIAIPTIAPFWKPAVFFLAGCGLYALLLGIEAWIFRKRPFIELIANLLEEISKLASARANGASELDEVSHRRIITDTLSSAYAELLSNRYHHQAGRSSYLDWEASVLQQIDRIFTDTLASKIPQNLEASAAELKKMAAMVRTDKGLTAPASGDLLPNMLLPRAVKAFRHTYWHDLSSPNPILAASTQNPPGRGRTGILDRLVVAPETVKWAAILALCMGLAFATRWINDDSHWYWTPLTVIIVLKPDLGSVFARTVLRVLGTLLGVIVGVLIFMLFPKGLVLVAVLAALAAALPWAAQRSYGLATFFATIIVLLLLDEIAPGAHNIDYGLPRLLDTLMGGAIILVFGYFLWPRTHRTELERSFQAARQKIAAYLSSLKPTGQTPVGKSLPAARRGAYVSLAKMRAQLQNAMQEPPPAGSEAVAWFPLVTSAERLCDDISAWAAKYSISPDQETVIDQLAGQVAGQTASRDKLREEAGAGNDPFSQFAVTIREWLEQMDRMTDAGDAIASPPDRATFPAEPSVASPGLPPTTKNP
ncbi:MAG: FUSC family protein [Pigmentiphaga sp.]